MRDITMPERIYAWVIGDREGWSDSSLTSKDLDDTEYVRADLADGDPNEPLVDGQYRWFKSRYEKGVWRVGEVCTLFDDLGFDYNAFCTFSGDYVDEWDVIEIGPVIVPPEVM